MKTLSRYTNLAVAIGSVVAAAAISLGCPEDPVAHEVTVVNDIDPNVTYDSTYITDTIQAPSLLVRDENRKTLIVPLKWTSSNPAVLRVIGTGETTSDAVSPQFVGVSEGDAVITAIVTGDFKSSSGVQLAYHGNISVAGPPAKITLLPTSIVLQAYQADVNNDAVYVVPTATVTSASGRAITTLMVNWTESTGNGVAAFCVTFFGTQCSPSVTSKAGAGPRYMGLKPGTSQIQVTLAPRAGRSLPTLSAVAPVTVGGGIVSITNPNLGKNTLVGDTRAFTAVVKNSGGATLTNPILQWSVSRPTYASINSTTGNLTVLSSTADGDTLTVLAYSPALGITGKYVLEVRRKQTNVTLTPAALSLPIGATARVYAHFVDANGQPVHTFTGSPAFTLDDANIGKARMDDDTTANVSVQSAGSTTLTVSYDGIVRSIPVIVSSSIATIKLQYVVGATTRDYNSNGETLAQGATAKIVATAVDVNGTAFDDQFTFKTTATGITLAPSGLNTVTITGVSAGTNFPITITGASNAAVIANAKITVTAPTPTGGAATKVTIASTPANATTGIGGTVQFTANATDVNGVAASGCTIGWNTDASSVASISNSTGLATGAGAGATAVRASCNGTNIGSVAKLTVTDGTYGVTKVSITPKKYDYVPQGGTSQFAATVTQTAAGATAPIVWSIDAAATTAGVTIDQTGLVRIPTSGSTTFGGGVKITATSGGQTDIAWMSYGYAGSMRGTITSASGRYLSGSSATATPSTGGVQVSSLVDDNGQFYLVGLAPGSYTVSVSEQGVAAGQVFMNVTVTAGTITPITLGVFPIRN